MKGIQDGFSDSGFARVHAMADLFNSPVSKQTIAIERMFNPPWLEHMKTMDNILNPPWLKQMKAIEDMFNPPWLKHMKAMDGILNPPWLKQMKAIEDMFNPPWLKHMKAMENVLNPPWLKAISGTHHALQIGAAAEQIRLGRRWLGPERTLAGAARLAASISPKAAPLHILDALERVGSSLLGQAAFATGQSSPSRFQLSTEALSTLATLELPEDERGEFPNPHATIVAAISAVQHAIEAGHRNIAQLEEQLRAIFEELKARSIPLERRSFDVERVVTYVGLLVTIYLSVVQTNYARLGEERAQRQDAARDESHPRNGMDWGQQRPSGGVLPESPSRSASDPAADARELTCSGERIVIRGVSLRASRRARSRTVRVLHPGDLVTIVEESGRNVKVEYADHLRETHVSGWVPKKYLRASK